MRKLLLVGVMPLVIGCTGGQAELAPTSNDNVLHIRVIETAEIGVFIGDLETVWDSHLVQPVDSPNVTLRLVTDQGGCPLPDIAKTYRVEVGRQKLAFALRSAADEALMSDLVILSCQPD